ncbi:MAG: 5-(carboxyamino)imidazole ribonucleotide mutase [Candidatus Nanoarchaeia archaeon]|nr:5-(carboxyamino)imidazole ribonucleotide mutase [Candidatus Nanoarchaeia archaeon]MDD5239687.1 5-(carboxyamino)imidazole ribonucleotide mutase [Candidatus Nanoarchaeia archaeon]
MVSVSIIAGSKSDENFVNAAKEAFNPEITVSIAYLSAHRDREELSKYVKESNADYFVAIAGLAAALPGSIAVDTDKPVIALPVFSSPDMSPGGLDALFAAVQMPPPKEGKNVALATVGINQVQSPAKFINLVSKQGQKEVPVCVIADETNKVYVEKLEAVLKELKISYKEAGPIDMIAEDSNIYMVAFDNWKTRADLVWHLTKHDKPSVVIPLLSENSKRIIQEASKNGYMKEDHDAKDLVKELFNSASLENKASVSVGYANVKNAAYFVKKLLGK